MDAMDLKNITRQLKDDALTNITDVVMDDYSGSIVLIKREFTDGLSVGDIKECLTALSYSPSTPVYMGYQSSVQDVKYAVEMRRNVRGFYYTMEKDIFTFTDMNIVE